MDGNWGDWSSFDKCTVQCGGGVHQRIRLCNNPSSKHGGLDCLLSDDSGARAKEESDSGLCNTHSCPGRMS